MKYIETIGYFHKFKHGELEFIVDQTPTGNCQIISIDNGNEFLKYLLESKHNFRLFLEILKELAIFKHMTMLKLSKDLIKNIPSTIKIKTQINVNDSEVIVLIVNDH